jgi:hypothetical protein
MLPPVPTPALQERFVSRAPDGPVLTLRVAALLVTEPLLLVIVTVYEPPLELWAFEMVYEEPVAPEIAAPVKYHW